MTGAPIFRKTMRDTKWMLIGMAGGIFVYALVIVLIYPLFKEDLAAFDDSGSLDGFLGSTTSIASPEGYIQSQMFIFTPILVVIMAIITGSAAFVGEQDSGTMDIVLAQPEPDRRESAQEGQQRIARQDVGGTTGLVEGEPRDAVGIVLASPRSAGRGRHGTETKLRRAATPRRRVR